MTSLTDLFKSERTLAEHVEAHAADATGYRDEVLSLVRSGVALASGTKARAAALLWRAGERDAVAALLVERAVFGVAEMLAFVRLLDNPRRATQLHRDAFDNLYLCVAGRRALMIELYVMSRLPSESGTGGAPAST